MRNIFLFGLLLLSNIIIAQTPQPSSLGELNDQQYVDLPTGDFQYSVPLLTVPGPGGGYPIVLNYKAGIAKEQNASWVGLGWSLDPGSINRIVDGLPDDVVTTVIQEINSYNHKTVDQSIGKNDFFLFHWQYTRKDGDAKYVKESLYSIKAGYNSDYGLLGNIIYNIPNITSNVNYFKNNFNLDRKFKSSFGSNSSMSIINFDKALINISNINDFKINVPWYRFWQSESGKDFDIFQSILYEKKIYGLFHFNEAPHTNEADGGSSWGKQSYDFNMDVYTNKLKSSGINQTNLESDQLSSNNLSFPAFDQYIVSASGLQGIMKPNLFQDVTLLGEGRHYDDANLLEYMTNNNFTGNVNFIFNNQNNTSVKITGGGETIVKETITKLNLTDDDIFICLDSAISIEDKLRMSDKGLIKTI